VTAEILAKQDSNYILEVNSDVCLGTCAVYSLRLNEKRELKFKGEQFCAFEGDTLLTISEKDYLRFKGLLVTQGFFAMDSVYDNPDMMDAPNYIIKVSDPENNFETHRVRARFDVPENFRSLKKEIVELLVKHDLLG
jgi:hypothetical protein